LTKFSGEEILDFNVPLPGGREEQKLNNRGQSKKSLGHSHDFLLFISLKLNDSKPCKCNNIVKPKGGRFWS